MGPFRSLSIAIGILRNLIKQFNTLDSRLNTDPGLPRSSPTRPFWLEAPPFPELVNIQSEQLPDEADIVIIGSGISGAAVARALFENETGGGAPSVVVLEARQLCSGATGRNGGHIKASPHESIAQLITKRGLSGERAAALVRFQLAHLDAVVSLCEASSSDPTLFAAAECRRVETVDLIVDDAMLREVRRAVALLHEWVPEFEIAVWSAAEARDKFAAGPHVVGAVSYAAGALWPYRFVTAVWKQLLDAHAGRLSIETGTPAEAIEVVDDVLTGHHPYRVTTPRGVVRARHVVHATNAFASHLLPRLRRKVTGTRAHMSAQRPGPHFPDLDGGRSWSVVYNAGFDYISQRPSRAVAVVAPQEQGGGGGGVRTEPGEVMVGGGFMRSADQGLDQIGVYDDTTTDLLTELHLHGVLPTVFGRHWGPDSGNGHRADAADGEGHVKSLWSGIIGFSADLLPLVGRLDPKLTGRSCPATTTQPSSGTAGIGVGSVDAGEWISAVFQGEGMAWAWLSGTALGLMVAGRDQEDLPPAPGRLQGRVVDWFPKELLPTYDRFKRIDITQLADLLM